jgi:hypothetical protein
VTFADLQAYFRTLEGRVRKVTIADHMAEAEDVEIELYAGGTGGHSNVQWLVQGVGLLRG